MVLCFGFTLNVTAEYNVQESSADENCQVKNLKTYKTGIDVLLPKKHKGDDIGYA